jgi:predicted nucleotidyltransferase component of viral defense system
MILLASLGGGSAMNQSVEAEPRYSAEWWENRTNEQLHELLRGGFAESEDGVGAHRELERRARQHARANEQEARIVASQKETLRLKILSGVLIAFLVVLAAVALLR